MIPEAFARRVAALAQLRFPDPGRPALSAADDHHLRRVLRARAGEEVVVTDGAGAWAICEVTDAGLERVTEVARDPDPPPTALYLALVRGERGEWAVAKAAEVGVARVVPLVAARCQVPHGALARVLARWRTAAAEAAGQCRRTHDLVVSDPVAPADVPAGVAVAAPDGRRRLERGSARSRWARGRLGARESGRAGAAGCRSGRRSCAPRPRRWWPGRSSRCRRAGGALRLAGGDAVMMRPADE